MHRLSNYASEVAALPSLAVTAALAIAVLTGWVTSSARAAPLPEALAPAALERFMDAVMADHFDRFALAGASVSIVHDGAIVLSKGYGFADLAAGTPVDAQSTLFATGSVAKLVTWMALMQLVEQGAVDLDADVNDYVRAVRIPATYPEPVRVWHLLSHTAGFEDRPLVGLFLHAADDVPSLASGLARWLPARIEPPGRFIAYSNYATALAAQVVAEVSGLSWEEYVEQHIFIPLGMTRTSVRQPIPAALAEDVTNVYASRDGSLVASPFEYVALAPAGGMIATTSDMAAFMLAHLQHGRLGEARVLEEATVEHMHGRLFGHHPRIPGNAHGFWEGERNGQRFLNHLGETVLSNAFLALVPEHDLGFYVAYNSPAGQLARGELWQAFMDHAFPTEPTPTPTPSSAAASRVEQVAGAYGVNRVAATSMGKLATALLRVPLAAEDGYLVMGGGDLRRRFVEAAPLEYAEVGGDHRIVFEMDDSGRVQHVFLSNAPMLVGVPVAWHAALGLHALVLALSLALLLSALLAWPLAAVVRRRRRRAAGRGERLARGWAVGTAAAYLTFVVLLARALPDPFAISYGVTPLLAGALVIGTVAAVMSLGTALFAAWAWSRSSWGPAGRVHFTLVALAALALAGQLAYWNLLGIRV